MTAVLVIDTRHCPGVACYTATASTSGDGLLILREIAPASDMDHLTEVHNPLVMGMPIAVLGDGFWTGHFGAGKTLVCRRQVPGVRCLELAGEYRKRTGHEALAAGAPAHLYGAGRITREDTNKCPNRWDRDPVETVPARLGAFPVLQSIWESDAEASTIMIEYDELEVRLAWRLLPRRQSEPWDPAPALALDKDPAWTNGAQRAVAEAKLAHAADTGPIDYLARMASGRGNIAQRLRDERES